MNVLNPMKEYKGNIIEKFEERDGKYVLEFDEIPALLFVSYDGNGTTDTFLYNGKDSANRKRVSITSEVGEITTYQEDKYAIVIE